MTAPILLRFLFFPISPTAVSLQCPCGDCCWPPPSLPVSIHPPLHRSLFYPPPAHPTPGEEKISIQATQHLLLGGVRRGDKREKRRQEKRRGKEKSKNRNVMELRIQMRPRETGTKTRGKAGEILMEGETSSSAVKTAEKTKQPTCLMKGLAKHAK